VKRIIILIAAAAALSATVATAPVSAAAPSGKRVATLEKQVKTLQAQVKVLQRDAKVLRQTVDSNHDEVRGELARNRVADACISLAVADVFQSTWTATAPGFGPQQELGDVACKAIGVTRPGIQSRPTVDVFWSIVGSLIG
jgi:outer membrane murein-binding lipoprotein Lpp